MEHPISALIMAAAPFYTFSKGDQESLFDTIGIVIGIAAGAASAKLVGRSAMQGGAIGAGLTLLYIQYQETRARLRIAAHKQTAE